MCHMCLLSMFSDLLSSTWQLSTLFNWIRQRAVVEVLGSDVVANSQHHTTCQELGNLPHVVVRLTIPHVAVVVVPAADSSSAFRRWLFKGSLLLPLAIVCSTSIRVVVLWESAITLGFHILRLGPVIFATLLWLLCQNSNVMPWSGVPIRVVVALLRAFQAMSLLPTTTAIAVRVLTRWCGTAVLFDLLICCEEPLVALSLNALDSSHWNILKQEDGPSVDKGCIFAATPCSTLTLHQHYVNTTSEFQGLTAWPFKITSRCQHMSTMMSQVPRCPKTSKVQVW